MLVLLTDTRKQLLGTWIIGSGVLIMYVLLLTLTEMFENMEGPAWFWLFLNILPVMLLLFVAAVLNKNPSKVLFRATFRAIWAFLTGYLALLLLTLICIQPAARQWSIETYLSYALYWLVPLQAVLVVVIFMLFFRKNNLLRPNPALMQEYLSKKLEFAQRDGAPVRVKVLKMLAEDEGLPKTLAYLRDISGNKNNAVTVLSGNYTTWKEEQDLNTEDPDTLQRSLNKMTMAVIDIIENEF